MRFSWFLWSPLIPLNSPWPSLVALGPPWFLLVPLGAPWYLLVSFSVPWSTLVSLGPPWVPLVSLLHLLFKTLRAFRRTTDTEGIIIAVGSVQQIF